VWILFLVVTEDDYYELENGLCFAALAIPSPDGSTKTQGKKIDHQI
jgi:hypothetical protein